MKVRVAAAQFGYFEGDKLYRHLEHTINTAVGESVKFLVLPELFNTIYFPYKQDKNFFALAEEEGGETIEFIKKQTSGTELTVIASIFEKQDDKYYLTAFVVTGGQVIGRYRKTHLPDFAGAEEAFYFSPGNEIPVFEVNGLKFGVLLCYDRHFPELSREYALRGAEVLFLASATGIGAREIFLPQGRILAFVNNVFIVAANRVGIQKEGHIHFLGRSYIASPFGKFLALLEEDEGLISAEIDTEEVYTARKTFNFYNARRPELYTLISKG